MILKFGKLRKQTPSQHRSARTWSCSRRSSGRCRLLWTMTDRRLTRTPGRTRSSPTRGCRNLYGYKVRDDERHSDPTLRPTTLYQEGRSCTRRRCPRSPPYNCTFYQHHKCQPLNRSSDRGSGSTPGPLADKAHPPGCSCPGTRAYYNLWVGYLRATLSSCSGGDAHSPRTIQNRLARQNSKIRCSTCIVHFYYHIFLY